ncbi:MAG: hypothetical protein ACRCYT_04820 [Cetobacterium sp.]
MDAVDIIELIEKFDLLGKDFIFMESKDSQKKFDILCAKLLKIEYQETEKGLMLNTHQLAFWVNEYRWILSVSESFDIRLILQTSYVYINKKFEKKLKISNDDTIKKLNYMKIDFDTDEDGNHKIDDYIINKLFCKYGKIELNEFEQHFFSFSHLSTNMFIDKFYKEEIKKRKFEIIKKLKELKINFTLVNDEIILNEETLKIISKNFKKVKRDIFLTDEQNKILRLKNLDFKKIELQINLIQEFGKFEL